MSNSLFVVLEPQSPTPVTALPQTTNSHGDEGFVHTTSVLLNTLLPDQSKIYVTIWAENTVSRIEVILNIIIFICHLLMSLLFRFHSRRVCLVKNYMEDCLQFLLTPAEAASYWIDAVTSYPVQVTAHVQTDTSSVQLSRPALT